MLQGELFTRDWLVEGIIETAEWRALGDDAVGLARVRIGERLGDLLTRRNPNEAETEAKLVWPVIAALGWNHISVQQNMAAKGRSDVPDGLLFPDGEADAAAAGKEPWQRFAHASALVEAKRWNRPLDRAGTAEQGVPSTQLMHYLRRADDITGGTMRWGILTNGRHWRLYWQGALSIAEDFLEIDLGKVFGLPGCEAELFDAGMTADHAFRLFLLLFGRDAFVPSEAGATFHARALAQGQQWEARVARSLSDVVFERVFPGLVTSLAAHDPDRPANIDDAYLDAVRAAALVLLYRLLFVLYAEDRNLLPDERGPYAEFALTRMRHEIAAKKELGTPFSPRAHIYWSRLEVIFTAIRDGDDALGIPTYNGGLFDGPSAPLLGRVRLPDDVLADALYLLSHEPTSPRPRYINYRDLSVQQLGSIYESILEYEVAATPDGGVGPRADNSARHRSGSYYTPEDLVSLIIERTVGPLVAESRDGFAKALEEGAAGDELLARDPASRLLDLKIVDPAMGSGHFLVSLVDWLSDKVLTAIGDAEALVGGGYASPLVARIASLRAEILGHAQTRGWPIVADQLDDRHIVRRMVLKRCVYGVDLNPMAVELAKVALWLHSFTVGAPLSFLDHHLRCGNSVLGAWVRPTTLWLANRGSLMINRHLQQIDDIAAAMGEIEALTDTDVAEVDRSKAIFGAVAEASAPLDAMFSMLHADALTGVFDAAPARVRESAAALKASGAGERAVARAAAAERAFERAGAMQAVLEGTMGDPVSIATGEQRIADDALRAQFAGLAEPEPTQGSLLPGVRPDDRRRLLADALVGEARAIAREHRFFHWEIAFPGVWADLASEGRTGGFDAVIGNPPYVRHEAISAIKPALQRSFGAFAGTADLYVYFYEQGLKLLRPGGRMGYVVTNKWLKAGYAAALRRLFARETWIEFLADFGHARRFFPDADVFPCVLVVRKPDAGSAPDDFDLAVIPRDDVPRTGLSEAVRAASYRADRDQLSEEAWSLEPPNVAALLAKIRRNGVPLVDYAGVRPLYGIKTGLNEAFLINAATKERLVAEDGRAAEIIKPYLRGQDIDRWLPDWAGLWMIVMKSSADFAWPWAQAADEGEAERIFAETYPSLHRHLRSYESFVDPTTGKRQGLRIRQDRGRFWWELRPCAYYDEFAKPKIVFTEITWSSAFALDCDDRLINNTGYLLTTDNVGLLANLNAPVAWWYAWRKAVHGKDEALRFMASFIEPFPIAPVRTEDADALSEKSGALVESTAVIRAADHALADWLRVGLGPPRIPAVLSEASRLTSDGFVASVTAAMPRRQVSPAQLRTLREAFADTAEPARAARVTAAAHERVLSEIVNAAYGLTPEDVALMWRTAPPRMPILPPVESGTSDASR